MCEPFAVVEANEVGRLYGRIVIVGDGGASHQDQKPDHHDHTGHFTGLLLLAGESLVVVLTIVRRRARIVDRSLTAAVMTTLSLAGPFLLSAGGGCGRGDPSQAANGAYCAFDKSST